MNAIALESRVHSTGYKQKVSTAEFICLFKYEIGDDPEVLGDFDEQRGEGHNPTPQN